MNQPEVKLLAWDSNFFGYQVGELKYNGSESETLKALSTAQSHGFKLIYLKSAAKISFSDALNRSYPIGVRDHKIIFRKLLDRKASENSPTENIIRYPKPVPNPELIKLALESGIYSRFALDPYIQQQEYEKLYATWINNSVSGEMADEVWVSKTPAGALSGMITLRKNKDEAFIGLLAVLPEFQRQGNGKKLLATACKRALDWGCSAIQVITQEINLPANSLYQNAGFSLHNHQYIYHLWL